MARRCEMPARIIVWLAQCFKRILLEEGVAIGNKDLDVGLHNPFHIRLKTSASYDVMSERSITSARSSVTPLVSCNGKSLLGTNHKCRTGQLNGAFAWCRSLAFRFVKAYIGPAASECFPCSSNKIKGPSGRAESSRAWDAAPAELE